MEQWWHRSVTDLCLIHLQPTHIRIHCNNLRYESPTLTEAYTLAKSVGAQNLLLSTKENLGYNPSQVITVHCAAAPFWNYDIHPLFMQLSSNPPLADVILGQQSVILHPLNALDLHHHRSCNSCSADHHCWVEPMAAHTSLYCYLSGCLQAVNADGLLRTTHTTGSLGLDCHICNLKLIIAPSQPSFRFLDLKTPQKSIACTLLQLC